MSEHLRRHIIERLSVDDLDARDRENAEGHLSECEACRAAVSTMRDANEAYVTDVPPQRFASAVVARLDRSSARSRRRAWSGAGIGALALAACLALVLRPHDDVRFKGGGVSLFLRRAGVVRLYRDDDRLEIGDQLQVTVSSSHAGHAAGWFVDVDGKIDAITPGGPVPVNTTERPLSASAVVEAPCRDLWVIVDRTDTTTRDDEAVLRLARDARAGKASPAGVVIRSLRCR